MSLLFIQPPGSNSTDPPKKPSRGEAIVLVTLSDISLWTAATSLSSAYSCSVSQQETDGIEEQRQKEKSH
jgi:hypothetical protein